MGNEMTYLLIEYTDIPDTPPFDLAMLAWYGYSEANGSSWTWFYFWSKVVASLPVDWPSMFLGIGAVTSIYLVIEESGMMQNSLQRVVSNVTLMYFASILIHMNLLEQQP